MNGQLIDQDFIDAEKLKLGPLFPQEYECVVPESLVQCNPEYKVIANLQTGDEVLSHTGSFREVEGVMRRHFAGKLLRVRTWYVPELTCTLNHPFLTAQGWKRADELTTEDYLLEAINTEVLERPPLSLRGFFTVPKGFRSKWRIHLREEIPITEGLLRILTVYICEGCIGTRMRQLSLDFADPKDSALVERLSADFIQTFGVEPHVHKSGRMLRMTVNSVVVNSILKGLCGVGSSNKRLPEWTAYLPQALQSIILDVAIQCDGHERKEFKVVSMRSQYFILQLRQICLRLGLKPSYRELKGGVGLILGRQVSLKPEYRLVIHNPERRKGLERFRGYNDGQFFAKRIRIIEPKDYDGEVVNCQVAVDNSFTVGFHTTHNCQFLGSQNAAIESDLIDEASRDDYEVERW